MITGIRISDLLQVLTTEEKSDFQRFVVSPYFNNGPSMQEEVTLLKYIIQEQNPANAADTGESFNRELAYQVVFPGQKFVDKKLEKLLVNLHALLKRFIALRQRESEEFENTLAMLRFFRDRRLHNRYENLSQHLLEELDLRGHFSRDGLKKQYLLHYELCQYEHLYNNRKAHQSIPTVLEMLESNHLHAKLELINQYLLAQKKALFDLPVAVKEMIDDSHFPQALLQKNPFLFLLYKIYKLLTPKLPGIEGFAEFQQLIKTYEAQLEQDEVKIFSIYLRNFCSYLVINNHSEYWPVLFGLQKEHYERGYLSHEGKISPFTLLSVTNTALTVGEIAWCAKFLEETEHNILGETPEKHYYSLCKANLLFYQGQYDDALQILPANFTNIEYLLYARRLELKCYYELESDLLEYKMDAFKMYLSRASKTTISDLIRDRNANFLNMLIQINKHRNLMSSEHAQKLLARIQSRTLITDREWLMDKVEVA